MSALLLYKNDKFVGIFPGTSALSHIHQGNRSLTVAQVAAEGWEITTKPRHKEKN